MHRVHCKSHIVERGQCYCFVLLSVNYVWMDNKLMYMREAGTVVDDVYRWMVSRRQ